MRRACCRASAIEGTLFLLSNEALDWNKPGVLARLQGWAIVAVGYAGELMPLVETRILKRRRVW